MCISRWLVRLLRRDEKCIGLNPQEINSYLELASIYRWQKWMERGIEKTVEAEKIYPQHPEALAIRAKLLQLKNQTREADDLLQRAIKTNQFLKAEYGSD
jgi:tetratricopeptide (TPR) repeat protein